MIYHDIKEAYRYSTDLHLAHTTFHGAQNCVDFTILHTDLLMFWAIDRMIGLLWAPKGLDAHTQ